MFRLVGTSVFLGVVLAALALAASAATVPPDATVDQQLQQPQSALAAAPDGTVFAWAQGQPTAASLPDAHERSAEPTVVVVLPDAHERAQQPAVVEADSTSDMTWARVVFGALVGAAFLLGLVWLTVTVFGSHRRHPPLAQH